MNVPAKFCRKCGAPLVPNAVFCDNCGEPTGSAAQPPAAIPDIPPQPPAYTPPTTNISSPESFYQPPPAAPVFQSAGPAYPELPPQKPGRSAGRIILIIVGSIAVVCLLCVLCGVGSYIYFYPKLSSYLKKLPGNLEALLIPGIPDLSTLFPTDIETLFPGDISTLIPGDLSTIIPDNLDTLIPGDLSTNLPGNLETLIPTDLGLPTGFPDLSSMIPSSGNMSRLELTPVPRSIAPRNLMTTPVPGQ